ncbi:hypothetical protein [Streptomyces roseolilacinus]|uniref:hypothetical protein n=1 Tax=Streptomyces roseolilacinus TaxID=66904 RepID=UPI00381D2B96
MNSAQDGAVTASEPPGPITGVITSTLWERTFDPDPGNPLHLPRIIRDGYPEWGLPSYDPATPGGTGAPVGIPDVPRKVGGSARTRFDLKHPAIRSSPPALRLTDTLFTHLGVPRPASPGFSDTDPVFTAVVGVGTAGASC